MSVSLDAIGARLAAGGRLTDGEAEELATSHDLVSLGMLADEARARRHGRRTTFVRVFDVGIDAAGSISPDAVPTATGEIRLVGQPASVGDAVSAVRRVAAAAGGRPLSGFALDEVKTLARHSRISLEAIAHHLRGAGLECIAEVPIDRLDDPAADVQAVVSGGLGAPRVTVTRMHEASRLSVLRRVSQLQRATGAIRVFAPLAREVNPAEPSTGYDDVKQVALARLLVDNIESIQVDWALYGPKLAQVALTFGADDVDSVSPADTLDLGVRRAPLEEILRNIRAASLEPVQRDGRFRAVAS